MNDYNPYGNGSSSYFYWKTRLELRAARAYRQHLPSRPELVQVCLGNAQYFRHAARQQRMNRKDHHA